MRIDGTSSTQLADRAAEFFKKADADGSGGISKDELAAAMQRHALHGPKPPQPADLAQNIFSTADKDEDGTLTLSDLQSAFEQDHAEGLEKLFAQADSDGDGSITAADLENALKMALQPPVRYDRRGQIQTED